MRSAEYSVGELDGEIVEVVAREAEWLRRRGVKVSTAELVDAARLLKSYLAVRGASSPSELTAEELRFVLWSVLCRRGEPPTGGSGSVAASAAIEDAVGLIESLARSLGSGFGRYVRVRRGRLRGREASAYAILKLLGLVERDRRGAERVLEEAKARRRVEWLVRRYGSLDRALAAAVSRDARRGARLSCMLTPGVLDRIARWLTPDDLASIGSSAARLGYGGLASEAARLLRDMLGRGAAPREEVAAAAKLMDDFGVLDADALVELSLREPSLVEKFSGRLASLPPEKLEPLLRDRRAASHLLRRLSDEEAEALLGRIPLTVLAEVGARKPRSVADAARAARAFVYALRALGGGGEGYLYAAEAELSSANGAPLAAKRAAEAAIEAARAAASGESLQAAAERLIVEAASLPLEDAVEAIRVLLSRVPSPREARRLLQLFLRLMSRRLLAPGDAATTRVRLSRKRSGGGRLDVRATTHALLRFDSQPLRFKVRERREGVTLLLDRSGSMSRYSAAALMAAYASTPLLRRLILFHSTVEVLDARRGLEAVLSVLASTSFEGYTDVIAALQHLLSEPKPGVAVLVSDLKQTVESNRTVGEAVREVIARGWRLYILAPDSADRRALEEAREAGARVQVFHSADDLARCIVRLLTSSA